MMQYMDRVSSRGPIVYNGNGLNGVIHVPRLSRGRGYVGVGRESYI